MSKLLLNKDSRIISRSFRFIAPSLNNVNSIFERVDFDLETSYFSTAFGDNKYINPLPGFGFNTDPSPAIATENGILNKNGSLGRYYKRIYDDNAVLLTMTAGAPEFTGILRFVTNAFDYASSLITNKGRAPSYIFYISQAAASIAFLPMQVFGVGMNFIAFMSGTPKNQWYYVKPTMGLYAAAAQGILNDLMVGAGIALTAFNDTKSFQGNVSYGDTEYNTGTLSGYTESDEYNTKKANYAYMSSLYRDSINEDGTLDVVKYITRGARKYRYFLNSVKRLDKTIGNNQITVLEKDRKIEEILTKLVKDPDFVNGNMDGVDRKGTAYYLNREYQLVGKQRSDDEMIQPEIASAYYDPAVASQVRPVSADGTKNYYSTGSDTLVDKLKEKNSNLPGNNAVNATGDFSNGSALKPESPYSQVDVNETISEDGWFSEVFSLLKDVFLGGMDGVTFRVEGATGPVTDSFGNETKQSEVASFFNGTVSAVNDFRFNTQGGTTGIGIVDGILDRIKEAAAGLAAGSVVGNIPLALMSNSRVIIPESWSDSNTNLHTESYEIYCEAMYGEPYSIATQVLLPVALLMPFFTPVATGGSSYTSPFMCKAFCRGRTVINLGMVKNATITFGEGEAGWTKSRLPRNARIRLDIADLNPVMSIPITRLKNPLEVFNATATSGKYLGEIGKYNDWVTRVTGQEWLNTILKFNKLNQHVTRFKNDFEHIFSPGNIAGVVSDSIAGEVGRIFSATNLRR